MASTTTPIIEGVFAIDKPPNASSAQVIRDAQSHFKSSTLFQPWLEREQARKDAESHNQRQKRRSWKQRQPMQVKMGHGGTLDPMATGVLILGVGSGTKHLANFLNCTKSYETVLLFGAATDTYDAVGKIVAQRPWQHITRETVGKALSKFRGKLMQKPPIFSALRVQGKRLYEYAREGKEVPVEIQERPVEVQSLEMTDWMDGGTHEYHWPAEEVEKVEKEAMEKALQLKDGGDAELATDNSPSGVKRKRNDDPTNGSAENDTETPSKRSKPSPPPPDGQELKTSSSSNPESSSHQQSPDTEAQARDRCPAPACRLRMTVTSGFYVRSLCHDLGAAVGSLGLMASLVRTRQGDFTLGENVLPYDDLARGEEVWGPKISAMLATWNAQNRGYESDSDGKQGAKVKNTNHGHRPKTKQPMRNDTQRRRNSSSEGD